MTPTLADVARIAEDFGTGIASTVIKPWRLSDNTFLYTIPATKP